MQPAENPEINRTAEIEPAIRNKDRWRVIFVDGTAGEVDMCRFLSNSNIDGTIFESLRDPAGYSQAQVVRSAILWPSGADLAPDAMYDAIREHGVWVLE